MTYSGITYSKHYAVLALVLIFTFSLYGKNRQEPLTEELDRAIDRKEQYAAQKEQEINTLTKLLNEDGITLSYRYELNRKLYDAYKKYRVDSAIVYAKRNREIAAILNDSDRMNRADICLASVYSYSGKFLESYELLKSVRTRRLSEEIWSDYYEAWSRFYEHYGAISNQSRYIRQMECYRDSLLAVSDSSTFWYNVHRGHKYLYHGQIDEAEKLLFRLLETEKADTPEYAVVTHYLGAVYGLKAQPGLEKKYYTLSAIADIKNAIKENASFQRLALIYYNNGDIAKAFKYTQSAIEDAVFSGVQFRTAQMSEFYSIINASYQAKEAQTHSKLKTYLILISILSLFFVLLVMYIYKQMKKLACIKEKLSRTNTQLVELNKELNGINDLLYEKNAQLSETNLVKEQYIAQFFHLCSTYIDKIEDYRKTLCKLGINRQYEELVKRLKSDAIVNEEIEELYARFDTIFLKLYPTFIAEFNSLLAKEERIVLKSGNLLTKELRIYALLRLGITDSAKIAAFLRCSMSTVYNYRTRMRNKADTNREEFEDKVMKIGMTSRKVR